MAISVTRNSLVLQRVAVTSRCYRTVTALRFGRKPTGHHQQSIHFIPEDRPTPAAARSKAWVCGRSLAEMAGLNPARVMDICLLSVLRVVG
jgi:hypothetical protein